ncbi:MAG TPA: hypothetical protein DGR97_08645 [Gammaproteobacteria bacterium]|nr:hypothetical protein [Gammaproteobacteria bacterium]|tara:strand:- start:51 stop:347 length:297 start_codon:yes stop_codon:yes gene_type:complete
MQKVLSLAVRTSIVVIFATNLTACATVKPDQLAAVEAKISSAMSEARSASSTAKKALAAATAASEAAAKAQATADDALSCCSDNKDRIERMFEQTMKK